MALPDPASVLALQAVLAISAGSNLRRGTAKLDDEADVENMTSLEQQRLTLATLNLILSMMYELYTVAHKNQIPVTMQRLVKLLQEDILKQLAVIKRAEDALSAPEAKPS